MNMENKRRLTEGTAAFYILDNKLGREDDNECLLWLNSHGFSCECFGKGNTSCAMYVNINSKVYNWGMAGVCLATPVGDHALKWDDFLEIYSVFEKYEGLGFRFFSKEEEYAEEGYKWKRGND